MTKIIMAICLIGALNLYANQDGIPSYTSVNCGASPLSNLDFICDKLQQYFPGIADCDFKVNKCAEGTQEIFTGVDLKPIMMIHGGKIPRWTQMGGRGSLMGQAALCSLRELSLSEPAKATASASTILGEASVESYISVTSFDPQARSATGYHIMKACLPVVGCLDGFQQKFTLSEKVSRFYFNAQKVGDYKVTSANGLELQSNGLDQQMTITLPAFTVHTPYGPVSTTPEFFFNRNLNAQMSPFKSHGVESKIHRVSAAIGTQIIDALMADIYGRNPGLKKTQLFTGNGWDSLIGLGSRDAHPTSEAWYQTGTFPNLVTRPDLDYSTARSELEKVPNLSLGASSPIIYSPTNLLPKAIRNNKYISISFSIFVEPIIGANYTSQLNFVSREIPKRLSASFQDFQIFSGTSVATSFALVTGVDLIINLHIDIPFVDDIDIDLINIHPRYTVAEMIDEDHKRANKVMAIQSALATKIPQKKATFFNSFGKNIIPNRTQEYIKQCLSSPEVENPLPPEPEYKPGNPEDLTEFVEYPCNICVGYIGSEYDDPQTGEHVVIDPYLGTVHPSHVNNMPSNLRWKCNSMRDVGCYDKCSYNVATDELVVIESAVSMVGPETKYCR